MKIAYYSGNSRIPSRGAFSVHIMKMSAAYSNLGHQLFLHISKNRDGDWFQTDDIFGLYGIDKPFSIIRNITFKKDLLNVWNLGFVTPFISKMKGVDLIHSRNLMSAWAAATIFKIPTIYELHHPPDRNKRQLKLYKHLVQSDYCKGIIPITNALAELIKPNTPLINKILVLPDGVEEKSLNAGISSLDYQNQLALKLNGKKLVVYTGHLYKGRGVELIIELAKQISECHFLLVGGNESDINKWKSETSNISNIEFAGYKSPGEVTLYQRAADILLMPYANQVFVQGNRNTADYASPLKMFEYMASGRPIMSSDLPVLKEVLTDGKNALLLPYSDINAWVSALKNLINNPQFANQISRQALEDVRAFTWERRAKHVIDFAFRKS